jgi:hypothetical protein
MVLQYMLPTAIPRSPCSVNPSQDLLQRPASTLHGPGEPRPFPQHVKLESRCVCVPNFHSRGPVASNLSVGECSELLERADYVPMLT